MTSTASPSTRAPADDGPGVVEIKTTSAWQASEWRGPGAGRPDVPGDDYLAVTGLRWSLVAALIGGQRLVVHRVERDDELIDDLLAIEARFWQSVLDREAPEPDGSDATTRVLARLFDVDPGRVEEVTWAEAGPLVARAREAKARQKAAETDRAEAENGLKVIMGGAELLVDTDGNTLARWPVINQTRVDVERLRAEWPEVAAAVAVTDSHRRFTLAKGGRR